MKSTHYVSTIYTGWLEFGICFIDIKLVFKNSQYYGKLAIQIIINICVIWIVIIIVPAISKKTMSRNYGNAE